MPALYFLGRFIPSRLLRPASAVIRIPEGRTPRMLWEAAAQERQQIRYLRPQRGTLEEVFLKAVERT